MLEMGTNEPGEIGALTEIAETRDRRHHHGERDSPGEARIAGRRAGGEAGSPSGICPTEGLAVVGDEPPFWSRRPAGEPDLMVTGWSERARPEHRPESPTLKDNGCYRFRWRGEPVELGVPGRHSVAERPPGPGRGRRARRSRRGRCGPGRPGRGPGDAERGADLGRPYPPGGLLQRQPSEPPGRPGPVGVHPEPQVSRVAVLGSMLELGEASSELFTGGRWKTP